MADDQNKENINPENDEFDTDDFDVQNANTPHIEDKENTQNMEASLELIEDTRMKRRKAIQKRKNIQRFYKILAVSLSVILAAFIVLYIICVCMLTTDKVAHNVWVGDLDAGGLTYYEVVNRIDESYLSDDNQIILTCDDNTYVINGVNVGLSAVVADTAKKVFEYGKSGNKFVDGLTAMGLIFKRHYIVPVPELDSEKLDEAINNFGNDIYGPLTPHKIEITENGALITPGKTGYDGDPSTAHQQILEALSKEKFKNIPVTLSTASPSNLTMEELDNFCYKDPVDAEYKIEGKEITVTEAADGRYLNKDEAATLLEQVHEGGEAVTVPLYPSYPNVNTNDLKSKLFEVALSSYSTNYSGSTANRAANVARAASLINGTILAPGETFSFNDTVGDRTKENGFYTAKEYVSGKSVDGIGGGTCQVSSTLYSAVLYADMDIVHRENHMMTVGYLPLGQDATVAYGSVDFKFRNNSEYPIKIAATTGGGNITVSILGTQWSPKKEVKISNTSSSLNDKTYVRTTRRVYQDGKCVKEERMGDSVYAPHS